MAAGLAAAGYDKPNVPALPVSVAVHLANLWNNGPVGAISINLRCMLDPMAGDVVAKSAGKRRVAAAFPGQ
jgi:hypothetical protein